MGYNRFEIWGERQKMKMKMKVFISWSGKTSFEVAKVLKEWIPCVIQDIEPYFSSDDIDKGARWSTDIAKELEAAEFGILCVTKDNLDSAWLNFEAGALSKAIDKSKVCPFLFNLLPSDISNSPILQFQMTSVDRDDMYKLFQSMNKALGENALEETRLKKMFELSWDEIDTALKGIEDLSAEEREKKKGKSLDQQKILEEMLDLLRSQQVMLRDPEHFIPVNLIKELANSQTKYYEELADRIPRMLLIHDGEIKTNLLALEEMLEGAEYDSPSVTKNYVSTVKELKRVEQEIFDRIGLNRLIRINRRS